jgi:hypothetical protein
MSGQAVALGLLGLLTYVTAWAGNDAAPNPNGAAEWRSCPRWLHRFLRRDARPVLVTAVTVEVVGAVMAVVALLDAAGLLHPGWGAPAAYAIIGAWVIALGSFILVEFRARFRF